MLHNVSSITPVWGDYFDYLPKLIDNLKTVGIPFENMFFVSPEPNQINQYLDKKIIEKINIIKFDSKNVAALKNRAFEYVCTEYVCFADADDLAINPGFKEVYKDLVNQPHAAFSTGGLLFKDKTTFPWPKTWFRTLPPFLQKIAQPGFNNVAFANGTIIRSKVFKQLNGFPVWENALAEDGALASLMLLNYSAVFVDQPSRIYNVHADGLCQKGHGFRTWLEQCRQLRLYLRHHPNTPWLFSKLVFLYTPVHLWYSWFLARYAKYNA